MDNNLDTPKLEKDFYIIEQKTLTRSYYIKDSHSNNILFAECPRVHLWQNFIVYSDEQKQQKYFSFRQNKSIMLLSYTVMDEYDKVIGHIKQKFTFYRNRWYIKDSQQNNIGSVREPVKSAVKRLVMKETTYDEIFLSDKQIGIVSCRFSFGNIFDLDLSNDPDKKLDRRLALAAAIILHVSTSRGALADEL